MSHCQMNGRSILLATKEMSFTILILPAIVLLSSKLKEL